MSNAEPVPAPAPARAPATHRFVPRIVACCLHPITRYGFRDYCLTMEAEAPPGG